MNNREVIGVVEAGATVIARAVAMQPGETYAEAVARQDSRAARIKSDLARKRPSDRILNKAQAEAIYSAICALNNVGDVSSEFNLPGGIWVQAPANGSVQIVPSAYGTQMERHVNQAAFAAAYGLN